MQRVTINVQNTDPRGKKFISDTMRRTAMTFAVMAIKSKSAITISRLAVRRFNRADDIRTTLLRARLTRKRKCSSMELGKPSKLISDVTGYHEKKIPQMRSGFTNGLSMTWQRYSPKDHGKVPTAAKTAMNTSNQLRPALLLLTLISPVGASFTVKDSSKDCRCFPVTLRLECYLKLRDIVKS